MSKNIIEHEEKNSLRINKYLAETGYASRREADRLIASGVVKINGVVAEIGQQVFKGDTVTVNDEVVNPVEKKVYIMLHKPLGVTCTTDLNVPENIISYMNYPEQIFPIGRLDKNSSGLILLTNDGDIVNEILRARYNHEKEYIVTVDKDMTDQFLKDMSEGVMIYNQKAHENQLTNKSKVTRLSNDTFKIILTQGLNRQIRRMADALGYKVTKLKRIRIMHMLLGDLPYGEWRYLTEQELKELNEILKKQKQQ